ncbi:MAG: GNAT family N-acetyltransferase [Actinomycetales bacterium]|jgi:GNAT superfamily N-acetyltransferase|nr:GNAT family N-acetyltransferase [Leifsonia sp.]
MTTFELAGASDAEAIGRFQTRCWEQTYRGVVPDSYLDTTTWQVRALRWRERISRGERRVWMARSFAGLIGVASTAPTSSHRNDLPALELCSIYVDVGAHGTGVAAGLLRATIGRDAAHLLVFTLNARAQNFYTKHGFAPTGEVQTDPDTNLEEQRWVRPATAPRP